MKANQAYKSADDAVSPVIGVILMVAITVVLAAVVFVLVTKLAGNQKDQSPTITFSKTDNQSTTGGTLTIVSVNGAPSTGLVWTSVTMVDSSGNAACVLPSGTVDAGDTIVCTLDGPFFISYVPTNTLMYTALFQ